MACWIELRAELIGFEMAMNRKERRAAAKAGAGTGTRRVLVRQDRARPSPSRRPGICAKAEALLDPILKGRSGAARGQSPAGHGLRAHRPNRGRAGAAPQGGRDAAGGVALLEQPGRGLSRRSSGRRKRSMPSRKSLAIDAKNFMAWQNLALGQRDLGDRARSNT